MQTRFMINDILSNKNKGGGYDAFKNSQLNNGIYTNCILGGEGDCVESQAKYTGKKKD